MSWASTTTSSTGPRRSGWWSCTTRSGSATRWSGSAVYNASAGADRRRVHRALAKAAAELGMVELEAWHAAKATFGTDAAVADRLEHAADLAARRGGLASRASILTRAAELTPTGPVKNSRLAGAAEAAVAVGAVQVAQDLIARIDEVTADRIDHGRVIVVRCALALFSGDARILPFSAAPPGRGGRRVPGARPRTRAAARPAEGLRVLQRHRPAHGRHHPAGAGRTDLRGGGGRRRPVGDPRRHRRAHPAALRRGGAARHGWPSTR